MSPAGWVARVALGWELPERIVHRIQAPSSRARFSSGCREGSQEGIDVRRRYRNAAAILSQSSSAESFKKKCPPAYWRILKAAVVWTFQP